MGKGAREGEGLEVGGDGGSEKEREIEKEG